MKNQKNCYPLQIDSSYLIIQIQIVISQIQDLSRRSKKMCFLSILASEDAINWKTELTCLSAWLLSPISLKISGLQRKASLLSPAWQLYQQSEGSPLLCQELFTGNGQTALG